MQYVIKTGSGDVTIESSSPKLAKQATEALVGQTTARRDREAVARDLTDAAIAWKKKADAIDRPSDELKRYYVAKSREAVDAAGRIIAEGERA